MSYTNKLQRYGLPRLLVNRGAFKNAKLWLKRRKLWHTKPLHMLTSAVGCLNIRYSRWKIASSILNFPIKPIKLHTTSHLIHLKVWVCVQLFNERFQSRHLSIKLWDGRLFLQKSAFSIKWVERCCHLLRRNLKLVYWLLCCEKYSAIWNISINPDERV